MNIFDAGTSPDGNGILFLFPLKRKRYSEQLDKAPKTHKNTSWK
jgi:hypothetical protein